MLKISNFSPINFFWTLVIFVLLGLNLIPTSSAMLRDQEQTTGNQLLAGSLQIEVLSNDDRPILLAAEEVATRSALVEKTGILPFLYKQHYFSDSEQALCSGIDLRVYRQVGESNEDIFQGKLMDYQTPTPSSLFVYLLPDTLQYSFSLSDALTESDDTDVCEFGIRSVAWQTNLVDESIGFSDSDDVQWQIQLAEATPTPTISVTPTVSPTLTPTTTPTPTPTTSPEFKIVINEVYYHGTQTDEFVELYNSGNQTINLKNWKIKDNNSQDILTTQDLFVQPGEFVVISSPENDKLTTASGSLRIFLANAIGNALANDDRVELLNDIDVLIDAVSWGKDKTAFNPSVTEAVANKSLARSPSGTDTDTAGDWINNHTPSPGE